MVRYANKICIPWVYSQFMCVFFLYKIWLNDLDLFEWAFKVHLKIAIRIVARYKLSTLPDLDQLYTEIHINNDLIIGLINLKGMTYDLDLKSEKMA